jgi:hypothetical protein
LVYDGRMTDDARLLGELASLLESLKLSEARGSGADTAREQADLLLARVDALTAALRRRPPGTISPEGERLLARLALADIAALAASMRAAVHEIGTALERESEEARRAYEAAAGLATVKTAEESQL